jgi:hypothetical protein
MSGLTADQNELFDQLQMSGLERQHGTAVGIGSDPVFCSHPWRPRQIVEVDPGVPAFRIPFDLRTAHHVNGLFR